MSRVIQAVRGTNDLFGEDVLKHRTISYIARRVLDGYGYNEIETPIFENTALFEKNIGESTDIVNKEMYTFADRNGDYLTLRPEGTASTIRAAIQNHLFQTVPLKLFYEGPMFRYERPQKGRFRQFNQLGVECFGISDPSLDAEVILLGLQILHALGITDFTLEMGTLGDADDRLTFHAALTAYFQAHEKDLSEQSRIRLKTNPLRILDSKEPEDQDLLHQSPTIFDYLSESSQHYFDGVCHLLNDVLGHDAFVINPRLVRGLDYYRHTAFEFKANTGLGAQSTLIGGGRYDGLVDQMGGPDVPGIGWAAGIERLAICCALTNETSRPVSIIPVEQDDMINAFKLAFTLRSQGIITDLAYSGNVSKRMKKAQKANSRFVILLGAEEKAKNGVMLKDMDTGDQTFVLFDRLIDILSQ